VSLLIHEATASCDIIVKAQISLVLLTCVPQQSSIESFSQREEKYSSLSSNFISSGNSLLNTWTTRTTSQYFSSKNILAPNFQASSIFISSIFTSQAI
jgi:hypothetical protein